MEERRFACRGLSCHYVEGGSGMPVLMLHGSGAGASTQGNWRRVLPALAERYRVYAMDLIGFGSSDPKPAGPHFDYPLWLEQCREMLRRIPGDNVGIVGHSLSGTLALRLAGLEPRIAKVMTTATMGASFAPNPATELAWTFPRNRDELLRVARSLVHDPALIDEAYLANRERILFNGDYARRFAEMFAGDKRRFIDEIALAPSELAQIKCDVLMLHGRNDAGFPAEALTIRIAQSLPQADVYLLNHCGHSVAFEHPGKFLALARAFFD
ncbi:MAG: alpha/beta hydrolase [Pigmentiphaga sp.]|uniref:alpha/beta fold hydrolase n=1 Tax=Pigmentiphaga sp. TaxID=1977564 RepID=UPI0029BDBF78|nr:alpha/beta hydrolase [Pigmentiphaga sp.]MDX3906076.1 alpha/beta hydrolase [Pigmentiphaga sp.]